MLRANCVLIGFWPRDPAILEGFFMERPDDIFALHASLRARTREVKMSLTEYLEACRDDPQCYASPAERLLRAIGEPDVVDTSRDSRLGRLFLNRTIRI